MSFSQRTPTHSITVPYNMMYAVIGVAYLKNVDGEMHFTSTYSHKKITNSAEDSFDIHCISFRA